MTARRTSQLLVLLAGLFGVLAFVCACASCSVAGGNDLGHPGSQRRATTDFPNGPSLEAWMAEQPTEFPKLSEP